MNRAEYQAYLNSSEWNALRARILKIRGRTCEYCSSKAVFRIEGLEIESSANIEVHHISYFPWKSHEKRIAVNVEDVDNFRILCPTCHKLFKPESLGSLCRDMVMAEVISEKYLQKGKYHWDQRIEFNSGRCRTCNASCVHQNYENEVLFSMIRRIRICASNRGLYKDVNGLPLEIGCEEYDHDPDAEFDEDEDDECSTCRISEDHTCSKYTDPTPENCYAEAMAKE